MKGATVQDFLKAEKEGLTVDTGLRMAIDSLPKYEDKVAFLESKGYKSANVDGNHMVNTGDGWKLVNQKGWIPDAGDIAEYIPELPGALGGFLGGAVGTPLGIGGTVVGTGLGYAAGVKTGKEFLQSVYGTQDFDTTSGIDELKDAGIDTGISMAVDTVAPAILRPLTKSYKEYRGVDDIGKEGFEGIASIRRDLEMDQRIKPEEMAPTGKYPMPTRKQVDKLVGKHIQATTNIGVNPVAAQALASKYDPLKAAAVASDNAKQNVLYKHGTKAMEMGIASLSFYNGSFGSTFATALANRALGGGKKAATTHVMEFVGKRIDKALMKSKQSSKAFSGEKSEIGKYVLRAPVADKEEKAGDQYK